MTRTMLSSIAVAATLSMATQPVPARAEESITLNFEKMPKVYKSTPKTTGRARQPSSKSGQQRAKKYDDGDWFIADSFSFGVEREMKESKKARGLRRKLGH